MREKLMAGYLRRKMAFFQAAEDFKKQEKGASDIVAILLVIVVLIAVAAIFREELEHAVRGVFGNLMNALDL